MKEITFNSMKLSNKWDELSTIMKDYNHYINSIRLTVHAYVPEPKQSILLPGYLEEIAKRQSLKLTKDIVRYTGTFTFNKPNLEKVYKEIKRILSKQNLSNFGIQVNNLSLSLDHKIYNFKHNPKAKGLTLVSINKELIQNKLSSSDITKLISKHFKFCQPSVCKKVYKEKWECQ